MSEIEDPCEICRDRHQKCTTDDNDSTCKLCRRLNAPCVRNKDKLKFRHGSTARYDAAFKTDQPWFTQSSNTKLQFVDERPELENYYAQEDIPTEASVTIKEYDRTTRTTSTSNSIPREIHNTIRNTSSVDQAFSRPFAFSPLETTMSIQASRSDTTNDDIDALDPYQSQDFTKFQSLQAPTFVYESPRNETTLLQRTTSLPPISLPSLPPLRPNSTLNIAKSQRLADSAAAAVPSASSGLLKPEIWKKTFFWPNDWTTTQCACLMRHFVDFIAPWFDVCDPSRHFALDVPQRARRCPPLLNAIFTASARHLAQAPRFKNQAGVVEYQGIPLYNLTSETAIQYHNAVLAYLIELSKDAEHVRDKDLLAAAVILQYYEEHQTSVTSEESETFLRTFQIFMNGQVDAVSSPSRKTFSQETQTSTPFHIESAINGYTVDVTPLQHASFRVALRQEITSAFMKQRPIRLHTDAWSWPRSFAEADDTVWANRLIVFCADVLQFCFGGDISSSNGKVQRWNELKDFEDSWESHKPLSFSSIHYKEPNHHNGEIFPQIWYLADTHVSGLLYLDLARILLIAYDPTVPRLGPGVAAALRGISAKIREIVLRICGVALSNNPSESSLLIAQMAIAVCGEHVTDRDQQIGMLDLLHKLEVEYARPTGAIVRDLERAWSCDS
ncbi:hypothetical protein VE01_05322 [Pseudogymnoascus verrucosus]|uniref:Zn(2)-C6 fungal-type domain-containing protein n=1 Tax=Pseudogymnoascus verrucosus TaxID=342668 RepID=A0A1B8GLA8_9PEZI|nr:uncharacterized protein VE01_05322 [Pseudogymnoascus verrucosus]OBT96568.2 hypothetical protein VE01_05322 [Pseudogymnoascus verrucosus]